jgi:hypothetical protein
LERTYFRLKSTLSKVKKDLKVVEAKLAKVRALRYKADYGRRKIIVKGGNESPKLESGKGENCESKSPNAQG